MRRLNMIHVGVAVKDLMSYATGEECDFDSFPVTLKDRNDNDIQKIALIGFKESNRDKVMKDVIKNTGRVESKFYVSPTNGCIITLYDDSKEIEAISFGEEDDDYPIKSMIPDDYGYIQTFFERFLNFRDDLIRHKQVVKEDDMFQYLTSVTGGFSKKETLKGKFQKRFGKK